MDKSGFRWTERLLLVLSLVVASAPVARAQSATSVLTGTVVDQQRRAIPGVTITVVHEATGARQVTVTRSDGTYTVRDLRAGGPYRVTATIPGFRDGVAANLTLAAAEERQLDFTLEIANISEELTVRAGAALAREEKRAARNVVDVVSADAVGRFPDANAAEALRRIPGVSLEIDQGEGRFVVVRGVDASLNTVTINGQIIGTPAEFGTRGVSMDSVPADLISRLEVVKTIRPDMDANAIGGAINIATTGAFDRPEGFFSGTIRTGYNEMSGRAPFSANVSFGRVLDEQQRWGLVVGGSFSQRRFDSDLFRAADGAWAQFNGFDVPQNQAFLDYDIERRRQGVNVALAHRPRVGHEIAFRFNHNLFRDIEGRQQTEFDLTRGTLSNQTPTSGRFSGGRASKEFRDYEQEHTINAGMVLGDHRVWSSLVDWKLGFSRGQRDTPNRVDWEFRSGGNAFPNTYDVSDPVHPIVTPTPNFYDAASYPFRRVRFRTDLEREDVLMAELNVRRDVNFGERTGFVKAGAKVVSRDKTQDRENLNYTGSGFTLADFGLTGPEPDEYFEGRYRFGPTLNLPAVQQFFETNPDRFVFDEIGSLQNSLTQDFTADETVPAGYVLAAVDFERWNLLAGVRVEHTRATYRAFQLVSEDGAFTGQAIPTSESTRYTDVLPGVHVNVFPRPNLTIRAAWTNTLGRPAYASLAPIRALDEIEDEPGVFVGSLSTGNPDLKPYESMNFDLSIEYYLKSGLLSVAPFYKRIDNPIYGRSFTETNYVYDDRLYERFAISQPENGKDGRIAGVEFNGQTYFTFLPAPFDGLGVNLNYTVTDSSVRVFGRDDELPFFKQSDHIGTAAVLYEKFGVAAQLSLSFNSPSLGSVGTSPAGDNYGDTYRVVDFKLSVPIRRGVRGLVEFGNLNDERRRRYAGNSSLRVQDEIYSWNLYAGLDWRFR
ncbi:MAG TPA: TonB-dependent receptor [Vicinamibacterales bacterium]|nr:TonB-dependent receptor [Vicinamibacterales bacterium]